jgi:glutamine synthetase
MDAKQMAEKWLAAHRDVQFVQAGFFDLNGQLRGKRMPLANLAKVLDGGVRMPVSLAGVDIWGCDPDGSTMVFESGDGDGICQPTARGVVLNNITMEPSAFVPLVLHNEDGSPFAGDPRQALADVVDRFKARGLTVVVATELEFYLSAPKADYPASQITGDTSDRFSMLAVDELDHFEPFLNDVYRLCAEQGIPADAAISENGSGQMEINLNHVPDPLRAADDAMLFKRIIRGVARKHGLVASFMAKPYGDRSGSGLHVHFSVLDQAGKNIFANGTPEGADALKFAVAGLLGAMPDSMAIFAPHYNSYRRFAPQSHAPGAVAWGYENRTTAIRIPGGPDAARRIEHRVSGADANPYLVLAAILGAALSGLDAAVQPAAPTVGDAYSQPLPQLPRQWDAALDSFAQSPVMAEIFAPVLRDMFVTAKRQELARFMAEVSEFERKTYYDTA